MFTKLISIFICFNTILGTRLHPKIIKNVEDHFLKLDGEAGSYDHQFDSGNSQNNEILFRRTNCGNSSVKPNTLQRIMGGVEANPHSWPWHVSVQNYFNGTFKNFCGGTIISTTKVLSAAHCFYEKNATELDPITNLYIVAGIHELRDSHSSINSQTKKVISVTVPSAYDPFSDPTHPPLADIAILHIDAPGFTFDDTVQPACLPTASVPDGTICYAIGWGLLTFHRKNFYGKLFQVRLPTISEDTCSSWYGPIIRSNMVCAGYPEGGKSPCKGDSGGPLLCNHYGLWVVDGITSASKGCGEPKKPAIFTRVFNFLNWINSVE